VMQQIKTAPNLLTEVRVRPLWHTGWVFTAALLCFVCEWMIRRQNGAS
jgi:hypothetical protein